MMKATSSGIECSGTPWKLSFDDKIEILKSFAECATPHSHTKDCGKWSQDNSSGVYNNADRIFYSG